MSKSAGIHIAKLFSSSVASQVLIVFTAPVITRLFSPEHFGVLQIFESIALLFFAMTCLKYEFSIPLGRDQQEASASFVLSLLFAALITACGFLLVLFARNFIAYKFNAPDLKHFLWLLPIFILMQGFVRALIGWASREEKFGSLAWANFGNLTSDRVLIILLGYVLKGSVVGLFIGRFAGSLVQVFVLFGSLGRRLFAVLRDAHLRVDVLKAVGIRHKKFPLFSTWASLLTALSVQLPSIIFGIYFSPTVVGYYALANRVVTLPSALLGPAVAQVFFPTAARSYRETGVLSPVVMNMFTRLIQISIFPMAVLGLFGTSLFRTVFGQQWIEAGVYAQIIALWHFLTILSYPLDVFALVNRQDAGLVMTLISLPTRAVSLFIGVTLGLPRAALGLFVLFSAVLLAGQLLWKFRLSQVSGIWALKVALKYFVLVSAFLLPVKYLSWIVNDWRIDFFALGLASAGYAGVLLMIEPSLRQFVVTMIKKFRRQ